jgi:hypothetical protein
MKYVFGGSYETHIYYSLDWFELYYEQIIKKCWMPWISGKPEVKFVLRK